MKKVILFALLIMCGTSAYSQYYEQSIGVRLGGTSGIDYTKFFTEEKAIDLMVSGRNSGLQFTAMYLKYKPVRTNKNLFMFFGGGLHTGYEFLGLQNNHLFPGNNISINTHSGGSRFDFPNYKNRVVIGADAIMGMEYRFVAPWVLGLNIKPYFQFVDMRYTRAPFWDVAVAVKFVL